METILLPFPSRLPGARGLHTTIENTPGAQPTNLQLLRTGSQPHSGLAHMALDQSTIQTIACQRYRVGNHSPSPHPSITCICVRSKASLRSMYAVVTHTLLRNHRSRDALPPHTEHGGTKRHILLSNPAPCCFTILLVGPGRFSALGKAKRASYRAPCAPLTGPITSTR